MLDQLRGWGVRPGNTLEKLWTLRNDKDLLSAFSEVMLCDFNIEGPDHGIPSLDPSFVPIAYVGNGDYYGLYCYPPAQQGAADIIVQHLHEVPCLTFEAEDIEAWIRRRIQEHRGEEERRSPSDPTAVLEERLGLVAPREVRSGSPDRITSILPTEEKIHSLASNELAGWLVENGLPSELDLKTWEREWVLRWVHDDADVIEEAALIDYGVEAYSRLGWRFQVEALRAAARSVDSLERTSRQERASLLWSRAKRPSSSDVRALIHSFSNGDDHSRVVLTRWAEMYGWQPTTQHPERRDERRALGDALVKVWEQVDQAHRAVVEKALIELEYEESLEDFEKQLGSDKMIAPLRSLRVKHAEALRGLQRANDWSDL